MADNTLQGHVALVTGGATGIGRAMAETMAKAGANVWIASRNDSTVNQTVSALRAGDLSVRGVRLDVTDRSQVESAVSSIVEKDKRIDILFNGAGVARAPNTFSKLWQAGESVSRITWAVWFCIWRVRRAGV